RADAVAAIDLLLLTGRRVYQIGQNAPIGAADDALHQVPAVVFVTHLVVIRINHAGDTIERVVCEGGAVRYQVECWSVGVLECWVGDAFDRPGYPAAGVVRGVLFAG